MEPGKAAVLGALLTLAAYSAEPPCNLEVYPR